MTTKTRYWPGVLFFLGLLGAWELACVVFHVPPYILPAPDAVARELVANASRIAFYTAVTAGETLAGFTAAVLLGIPLSLAVAFSPLLRQTLYPAAVTLEMIPKIAFAPLFVTWLGFGYLPKAIIVYLVCFFPILLNAILGFTSFPEDMRKLCRIHGATPLRAFFRMRLPAALPQLFVGLKGAAVNATVGACVSEWVGGDAGLGYYIQMASGEMRMDLAFAVIFVLAILGLTLFGAVVLVERKVLPWHVSQRAPG